MTIFIQPYHQPGMCCLFQFPTRALVAYFINVIPNEIILDMVRDKTVFPKAIVRVAGFGEPRVFEAENKAK